MTRTNKRNDSLFLEDMIIAAENVLEYTQGFSFVEFENDHKTVSAVLFNLQIIGEGAGKVGLKVRNDHPEIKWDAMKAFRNYVAHEYFGISLKEVWSLIQNNIPTDLHNLRLILIELEMTEKNSEKD